MIGEIKSITSASNSLIKTLRGLDRKKVRSETGLFMAEGGRLIEQALTNGWQIEVLLVSHSGYERPATQALIEKLSAQSVDIVLVPDRIASSVTRKDNPQTLVAAIRQKDLALDSLPADSASLWIGLHEVRDPGNLGTILRTADCAGVDGVVLVDTCCDPFSVEAVRASMGSLFDVALAQADFATFNAWRQDRGLQMVAASLRGDTPHTGIPFKAPSLILMGNEQSGLPEEIEDECDALCLIPMRGGADSLNLAQATAILTYEAWRQRDFA